MKYQLAILMSLAAVLAEAQSFDAVVDFNVELSSLGNPAVVDQAVESGQVVILEGFMGEIAQSAEGVWVDLASGAWISAEEVRSYTCRVLFRGPDWAEAFPESRPEEPSPSYVPEGSRLLIACRITGHSSDARIPLAEAVDFRVLN